jgi:hypothetical protein
MIKILFAVLLTLLAAGRGRAQSLFYNEEDARAMINEAKAQEARQRLVDLGYNERRGPSLFRGIGLAKTLSSRQDCIINAVLAHEGARLQEGTEWPDVLFENDVDEARYRATVAAQFPKKTVSKFETIYLPDYSVIYLADSASSYARGATIDDALAGEYARFLAWTQRGVRDEGALAATAARTRTWYRAAYPQSVSSCAP